MKKINQYLPFILWSIATIILTIVAFIVLPLLIVWKKIEGYFRRPELKGAQSEEETRTDSIMVI